MTSSLKKPASTANLRTSSSTASSSPWPTSLRQMLGGRRALSPATISRIALNRHSLEKQQPPSVVASGGLSPRSMPPTIVSPPPPPSKTLSPRGGGPGPGAHLQLPVPTPRNGGGGVQRSSLPDTTNPTLNSRGTSPVPGPGIDEGRRATAPVSARYYNGAQSVDEQQHSRRASTFTLGACRPTPSLLELAGEAGLLSLAPSDLVFESSPSDGIQYYDFVLSAAPIFGSPDDEIYETSPTTTTTTTTTTTKALSPRFSLDIPTAGSYCCTASTHGTAMTLAASTTTPRALTPTPPNKRDKTPASSPTPGSSAKSEKSTEKMLPDKIPGVSKVPVLYGYRLYLARLDAKTNVDWFETATVPVELLRVNDLPAGELALATLGVLVWGRAGKLANSGENGARLLCLVNGGLSEDSTSSVETLKRAAARYRCTPHVVAIGQRRRSSTGSTGSQWSSSTCSSSVSSSATGTGATSTRTTRMSFSSTTTTVCHRPSSALASCDPGMRLRIMMCKSRSELPSLPTNAIREARFLMAPSASPLLCLCFPLT